MIFEVFFITESISYTYYEKKSKYISLFKVMPLQEVFAKDSSGASPALKRIKWDRLPEAFLKDFSNTV